MDDIYFSNQYNKGQPNNQRPNNPNQNRNPNQGKKKKKSAGSKIAKIIFALIILLAIAAVVIISYVYNLFGKADYNSDVHGSNKYVDDSQLMSNENIKNILLIGIDTDAANTSSRSDTMMLVSIDNNNKKIKLTSFLRDSWVEIPDVGYSKLNAAYSYGGVQLTIDTLEYNFGVKIDNYMLVNYAAFQKVIDILGGVNVEVTEKEATYLNKTYGLNIQPGNSVLLNGNEALCYCRIRYIDSDFFRTSRQRKLLTSVIAKAKDTSLPDLADIAEHALPNIQTDLTQSELTKLSFNYVSKYKSFEVEQTRVPFENSWRNGTKKGQSVILFDISDNSTMLKDFIYNDLDAGTSESN